VGRSRLAWPQTGVVLAVAALVLSTAAFAAAVHRVIQQGRAFSVPAITIARGDRVEFSNEDEFIHQIYVDSTQMTFDSAEQPPGQIVGITFSNSGTFPVRCHIHPKMQLIVHVQ
jgi:plastocyanin